MKLSKSKFKAWRKYCATLSNDNYSHYVLFHNRLRSLTRSLKSNFESNILHTKNIKYNSKAFWKYVGSRLKTKEIVQSLIDSDGNFAHSDQEKANMLIYNKFFSEVFVDEDRSSVPILPCKHNGSPICSIEFTRKFMLN